MNKKLKTILGIGTALFLVVIAVVYVKFFSSNTKFSKEELFVEVPTGSTYEDVKKIISPYVENMSGFEMMAGLRKYDENVKSGRFLLQKGMGNFKLVAAMRRNVPVKLAFNNQERLENLCVRISSQIEPDTTKLLATFRDSVFLKQNGFTKDNVIAMFIPNSYEFYWNVSAEKFRDKMLKEYQNFWTKERLQKAENLGMTPVQVITLASIVHKETVKKSERPVVAKVYLNRLEQGMPLQADPTVIYALKSRDNDFDQVIKRVLYDDLLISSPYNTYVNQGLPPGPIAMPDIDAIDAVLSPDDNDYIYFCASVEKFGYHEFASTYAQHQVNAKKYADWLNTTGTKR
ncbi:endolytic transglycosylase MltG [Flavobacterium sp.]|uniref:endolytic transglycosylase MltG n=1 Tax=Flavobacterium sp. TaxID=239 RepID=UPI002610B5BD|nr:endolytic transglycosylase MltG [Flavobacterium sp.]